MKWLRRAKNSAILIDVILVILIFAAAIGFASFVHLRGTNKPNKAEAAEILTNRFKSQDLLGASTEDSTGPSEGTGQPGTPPDSIGQEKPAYAGQSSASAKVPSGTPIAAVLPALPPACDNAKKQQLLANYNDAVAKEDRRFGNAIDAEKLMSPLLSITSIKALLMPVHQTNLNTLKNNLLQDLAVIYCIL